jgi:hypothetical protein
VVRASDASSTQIAEAAAFLAAHGEPRQARAVLARLVAMDPTDPALARIEQRLAARDEAPRPSY